jgi:predicted nucleotidyltransferase
MNRSEILDRLYNYKKNNHERYRFTRIGIFGSVAKGISDEKSDIDIDVEQIFTDKF